MSDNSSQIPTNIKNIIYRDVDCGGTSWGTDTSESEMTIQCPVCNRKTHAGWGMPLVDIDEFSCLKCGTGFRILEADPCGGGIVLEVIQTEEENGT